MFHNSTSPHLESPAELQVLLHVDGPVHDVPAFHLEEEQPRALHLLHVQDELNVEVVLLLGFVAGELEAGLEGEARHRSAIRQDALRRVQGDEFGGGAKLHERVHIDDRSRAEEHGGVGLVGTHCQVGVSVPVEVHSPGQGKAESPHGHVQVLGQDGLGVLLEDTVLGAVVDVDRAATVVGVGRTYGEVSVTVEVDVA